MSETTAIHQVSEQDLLRRRHTWLLTGAAALLALLLAAGVQAGQDGGLLWVARAFDHPLVITLAILGLLERAAYVGLNHPVARALAIALGLLTGLITLVSVTYVLVMGLWSTTVSSENAPGRTDRRVVVESVPGILDPLWEAYVFEGAGPFQRHWKLGFFNGDDPDNELTDATWSGPSQVRIVTGDGHAHLIDLDPESGRPTRPLNRG
ncbi:hypothetical protein GCM10010329_32530 [Streptomyces spiroverticillatus]|uniref:Uncharacterized protein n=1 Tax=Streptomyces finlayi TaxID=67296 RepID=A0A919C9B3_9ACTN|nr:hypothetical protein [Streptomyces finlayi]GHA07292.1 hypothetical protein GCM10010329_32530 [Streptomyces spiroverticillatus]GHC90717.1 hypothetical protein GCM10010334_24940 [Streptomyces finlayi]